MADQMTVLAVETTGHVLGAITGVVPTAAPTVAAVAGEAMPTTIDATPFVIPAAQLAVAQLPFDARVFEDPGDVRVVFANPPDEDASLAFLNSAFQGEVTLAGSTLTVKVVVAPGATGTLPTMPEDTPFWVLFQGPAGAPAVVVTGEIKETKSESGPVAHGLTSGTTYTALVLLAGFAAKTQPNQTP